MDPSCYRFVRRIPLISARSFRKLGTSVVSIPTAFRYHIVPNIMLFPVGISMSFFSLESSSGHRMQDRAGVVT